MGLTIKEVKKAEKNGRVKAHIENNEWRRPITELLSKEKKYLTAGEIRKQLKVNDHIYQHLCYFTTKWRKPLVVKIIDGRKYYGLREWIETAKP